jgi:DNA polymerase-1
MIKINHYLEGRDPARIMEPGTFPIPGLLGARLTYGHDPALEAAGELVREPVLGVDIETMGLGKAAWYLKVVSVSTATHSVLFDPRDPAQYEALQDVLNCGAFLAMHNSPYDNLSLALNGLVTKFTVMERIRDTLIWARMADPDGRGKHSLSQVTGKYLGLGGEDTVTKRAKNLGVTKSKYFEVADLDRPAYRWDAATDALATARLLPLIRQAAYDRLTSGHPFVKYGVQGQEAWDLVERPQIANGVTLWRSAIGVNRDLDYLDDYRMSRAKVRADTEADLGQYGIRPSNTQDMIKFLDGINAVPEDYPRTASGLLSGAADDISRIPHPLVAKFVTYRQELKSEENYLSKVAQLSDHNGRVHPQYNVLGAAATGRQSITGLPFHQFDAAARGMITEDGPGIGISSVDWTQQEPVLAANLAGDTGVLERYEDETLSDELRDMYLIISEFARIQRKEAKVTILAQMYGQGLARLAVGLGLITPAEAGKIAAMCRKPDPVTGRNIWPLDAAAILGIPGLAIAAGIKDKVWEVMPKTEQLIKKVKRIANEYKVIFTLSGRILPIPMSWYRDEYGAMAHKGPNYTIQGGAADMLEETIVAGKRAGLADTFMIPMHDEVVVQSGAAREWSEIMKKAPERLNEIAGRKAVFRTDIADLGERWGKP